MRSGNGFTVVELAVASALLMVVLAMTARQMPGATAIVERQMETVDMQQRWRAAVDAIRRDVGAAGAGSANSDGAGLATVMPALWPLRLGLRGADPLGSARTDAITVIAARPLPFVASVTAHPVPARSGSLRVTPTPGCPPLSATCGLTPDTDILIADGEGAFDLFTVTEVSPSSMSLRHNGPDSAMIYPTGSLVIPVSSRTYFVRGESAGRPPQLMKYDGGSGPDVPVVDHVVRLHIDYLAEGAPPRMRQPLSAPQGPWTTYGARPPVADPMAAVPNAGSSCLFAATGAPMAAPALPVLSASDGPLVALSPAQLSDGPWCPDAAAGSRYDADLWRIRSVVITLRVESALDALRGPAGVLFARPGTASAGDRYTPDLEMRLRITPRNLSVRR